MDIQYAKDLIVRDMVVFLMTEEGKTLKEALGIIYNSVLYEKLSDSETGLYFQSSDYNYELLQNELKTGKLMP